MPFQFYCPQKHLLEAAESHVGQQSQCPICGTAFVIPAPPAAVTVAPPIPPPTPARSSPPPPAQSPTSSNVFRDSPAAEFPAPAAELDPVAAMRLFLEGSASPALAPQEPQEELVHLFCPNGHELETPTEMLGQDALCPHCQAQFRLRMRDTTEYKEEQLRKEREFNRRALRWAITTAVVVALGLMGMAVYTVLT